MLDFSLLSLSWSYLRAGRLDLASGYLVVSDERERPMIIVDGSMRDV
jgi:hypothetical protein